MTSGRISEHSPPSAAGSGNALIPSLICPEVEWQMPPKDLQGPLIHVSRWSGVVIGEPLECDSDNNEQHFITYTASRTEENYFIGSQSFTEGVILPGSMFMQGPTSQRRRAIIRSSFNFFRIYLSPELLADSLEMATGRRPGSDFVLFDAHFSDDKLVRELCRSIIKVDQDRLPLGPLFVESVSQTLAVHLVRRYSRKLGVTVTRSASPLAKGRLNRTVEYVEAHLNERIGLADLSNAVDLSKLHFAAQFRAATGITPYTYILKRRIEYSKQLLLDRQLSLVDVALSSGFSSQAHFTGVFKRFVGDTPNRWRQDSQR